MMMLHPPRALAGYLLPLALALAGSAAHASPANPVLYVTQVPVIEPGGSVVSIHGTHLATTTAAPRGGSLWIRYPDGSKKNLTSSAGFGITSGLQSGPNAIAVRDPAVHWDGQRALISMVVGAPDSPHGADSESFRWQIYEVAGLGPGDATTITRVPGQPQQFNNIQPAYLSGGDIVFVSDRTLDGSMTHYPTLNEQGGVSVTGLWKLDRARLAVQLVDHSPSGSFKPFVDSFGRVVFSRWDHLQRDHLATQSLGVDYASELPGAASSPYVDVFPEALAPEGDETGHRFDLFLPWAVEQDGTGLLTLDHLGRHELGTDFKRSRTDPNLVDFATGDPPGAPVSAPTRAGSYLHITECPRTPGKFVATDAVTTEVSAGRLVTFTSRPGGNPDTVTVTVAHNTGFARDPHFLQDGRLMGSVAEGPVITSSYGSSSDPHNPPPPLLPGEDTPFTIRIASSDVDLQHGTTLTPEHNTSITNYVAGGTRQFSGRLWQLQPVEVVPRPAPAPRSEQIEQPEIQMFEQAGVSIAKLRAWLHENDMALLVSRNVTSRDDHDRQQPYNLRVRGGTASLADDGPSYEVAALQFFQGDYVRGYDASGAHSKPGRRAVPRILHGDRGANDPADGIPGATSIAPDGSVAAIVPARRALTWQLTGHAGEPVVRERYWLSFAAGEIRLCTNCHGLNKTDQLGRLEPTNPPKALKSLLESWSDRYPEAGARVTPFEFWAELNVAPGAPPDADPDGDGLRNIEEFVYGSNPLVPHSDADTARPLASRIAQLAGTPRAQATFTRNTAARGLDVVVETSRDLRQWRQAATLSGTSINSDASVVVSTSATPEQADAGLQQVTVTDIAGAPHHSRYFRLRLVSSE